MKINHNLLDLYINIIDSVFDDCVLCSNLAMFFMINKDINLSFLFISHALDLNPDNSSLNINYTSVLINVLKEKINDKENVEYWKKECLKQLNYCLRFRNETRLVYYNFSRYYSLIGDNINYEKYYNKYLNFKPLKKNNNE